MIPKYFMIMWFAVVGVIIAILVISIFKKNKKSYKIDYNIVPESELSKYETMINNCPGINESKKGTKILKILMIISFVSLMFLFIVKRELFVVGILLFIGFSFAYAIKTKKYENIYKEKIVKEILKSKDVSLVFQHNLGMSKEDYKFGDFENFDEYHSEDLITGKLDGLDFTLSDVITYRVTRDRDGNTRRTVLFDGSVATLKLNKNIKSFIYIIDNTVKLFDTKYYVKIDNPEFEDTYDVYSDNNILAMRVLTPDVTTAILDLMKKLNMYIEIKIYNNIVYFRFHNGGLFEPNITDVRKEAAGLYVYSEMFDGIQEVMRKIVKIIEGVEL